MAEDEKKFAQHVMALVRLIPEGRVTSYGAIAKALGTPRSSRMVGWVLGHVKKEKAVPAHRVVNRKGLLTGKHHFSPPGRMVELLEQEGIKVIDNQVVDFKKKFWNPGESLTL